MGRDFPGREKKKAKKDIKKSQIAPSTILPVEVEVVRKKRKKEEEGTEE